MTTASLRFVLTGGDLTFSGVEDTNPFGLVSMPEPPLQARITYADDSPHIEGSVAIASAWQQTTLNAVVVIRGTSQADLEAKKMSLRNAIAQFSYQVVTERNGTQFGWSADMGSMAPSDDDEYTALRDLEATYTLTIPVRPTPEVI